MKNLTYLELYKREPKIARLLLINHSDWWEEFRGKFLLH